METAMRDWNLPEPIAAYFEADRRDGDAVARCFTNEGVVMDEGRAYAGLAVIPGSPVDLRFVFMLQRGKIASLEITP
jgi:hypothetical protein